jgi:hypothetical protein
MRRDENGVAVPGVADPLPWRSNTNEPSTGWGFVFDAKNTTIGYEGDTLEYIAHAANYHARLADIVRRLAVWADEAKELGGSLTFSLFDIANDAERIWAEMKGGGDEG